MSTREATGKLDSPIYSRYRRCTLARVLEIYTAHHVREKSAVVFSHAVLTRDPSFQVQQISTASHILITRRTGRKFTVEVIRKSPGYYS